VEYRDFRYIVPFIVQFGIFVSPVGVLSDMVLQRLPESLRWVYPLNPMVGVIDGFRWALLRGAVPINWTSLSASILITAFLCLSGLWYFRRVERTFADVI
jgi:lipopolysaccharide transport system permease protein